MNSNLLKKCDHKTCILNLYLKCDEYNENDMKSAIKAIDEFYLYKEWLILADKKDFQLKGAI